MKFWFVVVLYLFLTACATPPPQDINHICHIFREYPRWYKDVKRVEYRWHVPIAVQMAIVHQESKFNSTATPPRRRLLGFIPWFRPTSAYGYSQALNGTWRLYKRHQGRFFGSRDKFGDAVDFIGWYADQAHLKAGISKQDAYRLYLAYHEGIGGYLRRTYLYKPWLIQVAHKVSARSAIYKAQLSRCTHRG